MAEFTVGPVTGDYADWAAAWVYANSISPLADDLYFRQVENCLINNNFPATRVDCNGNDFMFYVPEAARHNGNPNGGLVTNLLGAQGRFNMRFDNGTLADNVTLDGLNIKQTDGSNIDIVNLGTWGNNDIIINVKNLIIAGLNNAISTGLEFSSNLNTINVSNLKIFTCNRPFNGVFGTLNAIDMTDKHIVEHVVVDDFSNFGFAYTNLPGVPLGAEWTFRNCIAIGGTGNPLIQPTGWLNPGGAIQRIKAFNCADTDGSLSTAALIDRTDCIYNVVAANEFDSLVETDNRFLFLKLGAVTADWTREPAGDVETFQKIRFDPEVTLTPGAATLNDAGIAPTLSSTDIAGKTIPSINGEYPIGAHVQEYST